MFTMRENRLDALARFVSALGRQGRGLGGSSVCRCPNCGYTTSHSRGAPCSTIRCPRCSTPMRGVNC